MPELTDKFIEILVKVGETNEAVNQLNARSYEIRDGLDALRNQVIKKTECDERHEYLHDTLKVLRDDLKDLKNSSMSSTNITKMLDEHRDKSRKSVKFWLGVLSVCLGIASSIGYFIIKAGSLIGLAEGSSAAASKK